MEWYKDFCITWQVFGFQSSDVWNMDKSGFMVGMGKNQKVITKDPCQKLYLGSVTVLAQLHIWHKSRTLPGSSICTVACLLRRCLIPCL